MSSWKSTLKGDPTEWLLKKDNPSVRYFTLIDILERPENDPEVRDAKQEIMKTGVVPKILAEQRNEGYWETSESFYTAKYKGTVWQFIVLAERELKEKTSMSRKPASSFLKTLKTERVVVFLRSGQKPEVVHTKECCPV